MNLNDSCPVQSFACTSRIISTSPIIQFLPLLLEVVESFLLLLPSSSGMEANEETGRIELETLRTVFVVDANDDHGW
jgi:hypothetical protein